MRVREEFPPAGTTPRRGVFAVSPLAGKPGVPPDTRADVGCDYPERPGGWRRTLGGQSGPFREGAARLHEAPARPDCCGTSLAHRVTRRDPPFMERTQAEDANPVAGALAVLMVPAPDMVLSEVMTEYILGNISIDEVNFSAKMPSLNHESVHLFQRYARSRAAVDHGRLPLRKAASSNSPHVGAKGRLRLTPVRIIPPAGGRLSQAGPSYCCLAWAVSSGVGS